MKPKPEDVVKLYQGTPQKIAERLKTEMKHANVQFAFGMGSVGGDKTDPLVSSNGNYVTVHLPPK